MTDQTTTQMFSEAPASWNTRYITKDGFTCQFTLRGENGTEVLSKAQAAIKWLQKHDCQPLGNGKALNESNSNGDTSNDNPSWCKVHDCEMKRWDKDGRVWYSHKVNGDWCNGKAK